MFLERILSGHVDSVTGCHVVVRTRSLTPVFLLSSPFLSLLVFFFFPRSHFNTQSETGVLLSASADGTIREWQLPTGASLYHLSIDLF
jgi:WD40 repeat protein